MSKALIVSELGVNMNGSLVTAIEMIKKSKAAGCDFVKTQTRTTELSVPEAEWNDLRDTPFGEMTKLDYRRRMELSDIDYSQIIKVCQQEEIGFFTSVWDIPSLERMTKFNLPYIKIPSTRVTDLELLEVCRDCGIPLIMSSGMCTQEELDTAVNLLSTNHSLRYLLHCHSGYPAPMDELNLRYIETMRKKYQDRVMYFGFSNHSTSPYPAIYSILSGADMVECHYSLDRSMPGTDQASSLEFHGLEILCREARLIPKELGDGLKRMWPSEIQSRKRLQVFGKENVE